LQIVRTLVTSELGGTIQWQPREGGGTAVQIRLSLAAR
jgi:C4-dicarboxylate-specific signal transduction histidine kinase